MLYVGISIVCALYTQYTVYGYVYPVFLCATHHHSMSLQKINNYLYNDGLKLLD
jgi:hypothetical protein